ALPRAFVVYRAWPVPPTPELLRELSTETFDPLVASFVETDPGFRPGPGSPQRGEAAVFDRDDEDVVEVEATLAAPGLLVLADSCYPGWHAPADGIEVPILATNHLFRSVPLPPGHHRVRFEYRPWTVPAGAAATVIGLLLIVALWRRGRAAPAPAPSQKVV